MVVFHHNVIWNVEKMLMDIKIIDIVEAGADVAVVYTPCYYKVFMMMVLMMLL